MDVGEGEDLIVWRASELLSYGSGLIYEFITGGYVHDVELMKRYAVGSRKTYIERKFFCKSKNTLNESDLRQFVDGRLVELHFNSSGYAKMDVDLDAYDLLGVIPDSKTKLRYCCTKKKCCSCCFTFFAIPAMLYVQVILEQFLNIERFIFTYSGSKGFHVHIMGLSDRTTWKSLMRKFILQRKHTFLDFLNMNTVEDMDNIGQYIIKELKLGEKLLDLWEGMYSSGVEHQMVDILDDVAISILASIKGTQYGKCKQTWVRRKWMHDDSSPKSMNNSHVMDLDERTLNAESASSVEDMDVEKTYNITEFIAKYSRKLNALLTHVNLVKGTSAHLGLMYTLLKIFAPRLDEQVTLDATHMIRIPCTPNPKTNYMVFIIDKCKIQKLSEYMQFGGFPKMTSCGVEDEAELLLNGWNKMDLLMRQ